MDIIILYYEIILHIGTSINRRQNKIPVKYNFGFLPFVIESIKILLFEKNKE
jgi:hypothetical protein